MAPTPPTEVGDVRQDAGGAPRSHGATVCLVVLLALGFFGHLRFGYEWDELQLFHGAWNIGHGLVPYRDFFEHHPVTIHYLLAPLLKDQESIGYGFLVTSRLIALLVLGAILRSFRSLLRIVTGPIAAAWGPVALLVGFPVSGKFFELRADWLALLALLGAMLLLVRQRNTGGRGWPSDYVAGGLGGVAICFTQKAVPLWAGVALCAIWARHHEAGALPRAARLRRILALAAGTITPIALLVLTFVLQHAAAALYADVVTINLSWPREVAWQWAWSQDSRAALGLVTLAGAYVGALGCRRGHAAPRAPVEYLVAVAAVAGVIAYRMTPVPWAQSLLLFVAPWVTYLGIVAFERYVSTPDAPCWGALLVACPLTLATSSLRLTGRWVGLWLVVGATTMWVLRARGSTESRRRRGLLLLLYPGLVLFVGERAAEFGENRASAQLQFARTVESRLGPHDPVLTMWDHVLPFHPAPTYHWFAHEGVLMHFADRTADAEALDSEYVAAIEQAKVRVALVNPIMLREYLPRLQSLLQRRCTSIPSTYGGSQAYVCPSVPAGGGAP